MSDKKSSMNLFKIRNIHPEKPEKTVSELRRELYEIFRKYK